jgi:hypothetical protein
MLDSSCYLPVYIASFSLLPLLYLSVAFFFLLVLILLDSPFYQPVCSFSLFAGADFVRLTLLPTCL